MIPKYLKFAVIGWAIWIALVTSWYLYDFETSKIETYDVIGLIERDSVQYAIYKDQDQMKSYLLSPEEIYLVNLDQFKSVKIRRFNNLNSFFECISFCFLFLGFVFTTAVTAALYGEEGKKNVT